MQNTSVKVKGNGHVKTRGRLVTDSGMKKKSMSGDCLMLIDALDGFLREFQKQKITVSGMHLLILLYRGKDSVVRLSEFAPLIGVTCGGATGVADQLVKRGLATRNIYPDDRRSVYLALTPAGEEVTEWIEQTLVDSFAGMLTGSVVSADQNAQATGMTGSL